ncbi:MAG: VanW family protein [Oscillospiraceae bacterium]|nr:VanW family protein [Oscillospiraceae bacterium]
MEQSTPKKKIPVGLIAGLTAAALVIAAVSSYLGLCAWVRDNDQLLPGAVAVDDQGATVADLGKLTREDALAVVTEEMDQRLDNRTLTLLYGEDKRVELTGELMACAPEAAVDVGFSAKESQPFWKLGALWLGVAKEPTDLSLSAAAFTPEGEAEAKRVIQSIADELYVEPVDFTYELGDEDVTVTPGNDGQKVDTDALLEAVEEALAQGQTELTVEPETVPSAELSGESLHELIYVEPKAAGVDEDGKLTPAVIGLSVNAEEAQSCLDAAEPGQPVTIPLEFTPPGTTGDESLYYKDLLASVTTNLDGVANRSFNVARAASFCNGKVLQPGEVFSYIGTIGDPSTANGYRTSTGYQNGETVPMDGGGVCQMSSSLYYCAVYSNLEIVRRACHAFATGYIPNGLDATIYYPSLDFKFRNNTGFPIKIVAYCEGGAWGKLTVQFYGSNPDGIKVETQRYTQSSTPWTTVYEPDETIPRGTTKVKTTPYTGYVVDVYRCVYDANGSLLSRTFENHSTYAKRDKVVLYNPADAAYWGLPVDPGVVTTPEVPPVVEPPIVTDPPVIPTDDPNLPPIYTDPWVDPTPEPTPTQYVDLPGEGGWGGLDDWSGWE